MLKPHFDVGVSATPEHVRGDIGAVPAQQEIDMRVCNGEISISSSSNDGGNRGWLRITTRRP
jgi:hypothetical protein